MKINDFLLKMWNDYCQLNPHINQVLNLIKAKEPNEIINDHNLISSPWIKGYKATSKKTTKKTIKAILRLLNFNQ